MLRLAGLLQAFLQANIVVKRLGDILKMFYVVIDCGRDKS